MKKVFNILKLKLKNKKFFVKLLITVLIIFILIFAPTVAFSRARNFEIYSKENITSKIYTVLHIETFEGGKKSRIDFLKSVAREIESSHAGIYFMIKSISADELESYLSESTPDLISFGFGLGKSFIQNLVPFDSTYDIRDELILSGSFNGELVALPYIVSGYALFRHNATASEFHCGQTGYTFPEKIYSTLNFPPIEAESQYDAYKDFVYDKNVVLLGTGRDVFRVDNLNKVGRANAMIEPIDTYTDLIQYLAKFTDDDITREFCSLALSDEFQRTLTDYSLYSAKYNKIYTDGIYSDMENAIMSCEIARAFEY